MGRHNYHTEGPRKRLFNMTEEERAFVGERNRLSAIQMLNLKPTERRQAARLEDAEHGSLFCTTDLVRSQWNEHERVRIAGRFTQRTADLNRLAF